MLRKRWIALAGVSVAATSFVAWAATTYQVQTKMSTAGGTLKVREKALQTSVGTVVYSNFTTHALVPVTVTAKPGYTIASITQTGQPTVSNPSSPWTGNFLQSRGTIQSLTASFAPIKYNVSGTASGSGSVSPSTATAVNNGTVKMTATPTYANGYVNKITLSAPDSATYDLAGVTLPQAGVVPFTLNGITGNETVTVEFGASSVTAVASQAVAAGSQAALAATLSGPGTLTWTQTGGPTDPDTGTMATVTLSNPASATPTFTPTVAGTYNFKVTDTYAGAVLSSATATVTVTAGDPNNTCMGCHNPTGGAVPSTAAPDLAASPHSVKTCIECHSYSSMPSPTNTATVSPTTYKNTAGKDYCATCHTGASAPTGTDHQVPGTCATCHTSAHSPQLPAEAATARTEFLGSAHWVNHLETGPEFTDPRTGDGVLNANESWTTNENDEPTTCAYRCHFKPGMYPAGVVPPAGFYNVSTGRVTTNITYTDTLNGVTYTRPGGDGCTACHDSENTRTAGYQTCLVCHSGSKHGKVPNEFFGSKHWQNNFEYGDEFASQTDTVVQNGNVKNVGTKSPGYLNANDSYTTTENGGVVTCAYRCHFRPGMGPNKDVKGYLAAGKATTYVMYSSPYGAGKFTRPGGDACMACHSPHGLEASARSTCYTCHAGGNHGWSVKAFEKSTHFTGTYAIYDGIGGPTGEACTACHNAHSLEAEFANMTTSTKLHTAALATGCQKCHTPGADYSIFDADGNGKAGHFQTGTADATGFYAAGSYIQPATVSATCADCHSHNNTMNAGWAESGHGSTTSAAWTSNSSHTWLEQGGTQNFQVSPQSTNCIRCHSAQGFIQFVDSGFTSVAKIKNADGTAVKASSPLSCNACHSNVDKGTVRVGTMAKVGYKAFWGYSGALANKKIVTSIQLGDNRNSNVCMPCHSQRASGQEVKDFFANAKANGYMIGTAIYPHEAQPAAIFYGVGGYEFTVQKGAVDNGFAYQDRARHQRIGNYGTTGTGYNDTGITQGACVGCHMNSSSTHTMEIGTKDANGDLTSITSTECAKCHPAEFTYQDLNQKKAELKALVDALGNLLVKKGLTNDGINPLPERTNNFDMSLGSFDLVKAEKNYGAWFNWYLFKTADPAAYAHNPSYARRLLTDSIDWLDDNTLNSSAANTILEMGNVSSPNYNPAVDTSKAASYTNDPGCLGCHGGATVNSTTAPGVETTPHYNLSGNLVEGTTYTQAQFVVPGSQCNNCHGYGHGTDSPGGTILAQYGESGHADINSPAWADYDFKNRTGGCVVCHTTTGFVKGVNTNFTDTNTTGAFGDTTKQVLGCNACHSSTAWKTSIRNVNASSLGVVSPISYDNVGESNVCIPCHATRENTATVNSTDEATFSNLSFKNPHYLGAAAVFYGKGGFQFYTSGVRYNTYGAAGKVGRNANWSHGRLGMDNYTTTTNATVKASGVVYGSGNKGQCVACHLGSGNNHTFNATEVAKATMGTSTYTRGCYGCHTGTNMNMEEFINEEKVIWDRMMDFFSFNLKQVNLRYTDAYPYFQYERTENGVTAGGTVKNWTFPATGPNGGTSKQTMGAALNFKLLAAEPGKHVHNRSFGRALIADSIVYLQKGAVGDRTVVYSDQNGVINFSNYSAANPVGNGVSITTLKSYLTKSSGGGYVRR